MDQVCEEVALMRKDLKSIEKSLDRLLDALFEREKSAKSWQNLVNSKKEVSKFYKMLLSRSQEAKEHPEKLVPLEDVP